jgi:glycosyltransferase involved in cell wall biosynthesis
VAAVCVDGPLTRLVQFGAVPAMRVCLSCIELFGVGIYGGFGRATRFIGRELVRRGIDVTIVVPRRTPGHAESYALDGIQVFEFDPRRPWSAARLFRAVNADVYHSQDTSLGSAVAVLAAPDRRHVITFRDPLDPADWRIESGREDGHAPGWRMRRYRAYVDNPLVRLAVAKADARFCSARFVAAKAVAKYGLAEPPAFLPTPVDVPDHVVKAARPTVCFVGRWHRRKRPERFFELARQFPDVDFISVGGGGAGPVEDARLRALASEAPNLEVRGIIDQFHSRELSRILARSWILVNTSSREGLPTTFLEAAAHRCAILSYADPDGFASRFGCRAGDQPLAAGLEWLLEGNRWRARGELARAFIAGVFDTETAMAAHLDVYRHLLASAAA